MRAIGLTLIAILCLAAAGCSDSAKPPAGRWQGGYADDSIMIVARVEIGEDGRVRLSAPNAIMDFAALQEPGETVMRTRLLASLAAAWPNVTPRDLDFDGKVFRNPGGVAPQLEWDVSTQKMTMFVYPGARPSVQFQLERVTEFKP